MCKSPAVYPPSVPENFKSKFGKFIQLVNQLIQIRHLCQFLVLREHSFLCHVLKCAYRYM